MGIWENLLPALCGIWEIMYLLWGQTHCSAWCLLCVLVLQTVLCSSVRYDVILAVVFWDWRFLMCISGACQWWCSHFFLRWESAFKALVSISWRWQWRDAHEDAFPGNCWAFELFTYQWNVSKVCLFVFILASSSRTYHNIFQGGFTPKFLKLFSFCRNTEFEIVRPLCTDIIDELEMYAESACSYLLFSHHASWGSLFMFECMDLAACEIAVYSHCREDDKVVMKMVQVSTQMMGSATSDCFLVFSSLVGL